MYWYLCRFDSCYNFSKHNMKGLYMPNSEVHELVVNVAIISSILGYICGSIWTWWYMRKKK